MKKTYIGKIKAVLCIFLICSLMILSACTASPESVVLSQDGEGVSLNEEKQNKKLFCENKSTKELKRISRSDMTVLYLDEENCNVSVYDYAGKKLWNSLPEKYTDGAPCVISVDVLVGAQQYTLNSQTHSVQKGLASYEIKNGSVTVIYGFDTALSDGTKIKFSVPVCFEAVDGVVTVSVDCSKIKADNSKVKIKTLHLLEYFGSSVSAGEDDYILIPDGCGAIIDIGEKAKEFDRITVPVYGADYSSGETNSKAQAYVAAYGIKSGDSAFVAVVENGEAIAKITADKALKKTSYNRVGASFDLIKTYSDGGKVYASKNSYDGEVRITYRLISGNSANYVGMASACRETLIRNGMLGLQELSEETTNFPFVLTLIGSANITAENTKKAVLTSFEEAQEILSFFRSKGISNIVLRYKGMFDGGLSQTDVGKLKLNSALGSKNSFSDLLSYTSSQNIDFYADINLISASGGKVKEPAVTINGETASAEFTNLKNKVIYSADKKEFSSAAGLSDTTNSVIALSRELAFSGISLSDAGKVLCTDYSSKSYSGRQQTEKNIFSLSGSISSSKKLMVDEANIYTVKYADYIVNLPISSSLEKRDDCSNVPFMQAVLHGVVPYSGTAINLSSNTDTALLKAAEYGCLPSYELYYKNYGTDGNADSYHYANYGTDAQSCYERLLNTFSDLENKKMTAHYTVKKGVTCTEYAGNISVYVNYNKKDVNVGGVTVEARSFLRVG